MELYILYRLNGDAFRFNFFALFISLTIPNAADLGLCSIGNNYCEEVFYIFWDFCFCIYLCACVKLPIEFVLISLLFSLKRVLL